MTWTDIGWMRTEQWYADACEDRAIARVVDHLVLERAVAEAWRVASVRIRLDETLAHMPPLRR